MEAASCARSVADRVCDSLFFLMRRRPPRSTPLYSSAASDVYKRQALQWNGAQASRLAWLVRKIPDRSVLTCLLPLRYPPICITTFVVESIAPSLGQVIAPKPQNAQKNSRFMESVARQSTTSAAMHCPVAVSRVAASEVLMLLAVTKKVYGLAAKGLMKLSSGQLMNLEIISIGYNLPCTSFPSKCFARSGRSILRQRVCCANGMQWLSVSAPATPD